MYIALYKFGVCSLKSFTQTCTPSSIPHIANVSSYDERLQALISLTMCNGMHEEDQAHQAWLVCTLQKFVPTEFAL